MSVDLDQVTRDICSNVWQIANREAQLSDKDLESHIYEVRDDFVLMINAVQRIRKERKRINRL